MEQFPSDVLESLKKTIWEMASNHEVIFDYCLACDQGFYDAVKEYLISVGMFNPQTDELKISSPAKEPNRIDVKVVKRLFEFDLTIDKPEKENTNE